MVVQDNTVWSAEAAREHQKYMSTTVSYSAEDLLRDGAAAFPGLEYHAVVFGQPTPACNQSRTNAYASEAGVGCPKTTA